MFKTKVEDNLSFVAWMVQQLAAPVLACIFTYFALKIPAHIINRTLGRPMDNDLETFLSTIFFSGVGFLLAVVVERVFPRANRTGKWIWVLPVSILAIGFARDLSLFSAKKVLAEFFYPDSGEGAWAFMLLTCPTYACILYSSAMMIRARRKQD